MADELEVRAKLIADAGDFITPMQAATASLQQFQKALSPSTKALTLFGAAAGVGGYAIVRYGKEAFSVAAKVSELKVAIDAVGKSTGLGATAINNAAKAIRKNGIEMDAAQNIALKFAQNNLDLSKAADVARVAQDLAVISQRNSTDTAELLTRAIQTGSSILLKSAGISRYASEGYAKYAKQLGKNATELTATERQQATINLIMEEGTRVAGLYEAAMTEPGKVLRSFKRLQNDIQLEMGDVLLKGFGPMIKAAYDLVKSFSETLREGGAFSNILKAMGIAFKDLLQPMSDMLSRGHLFFKDLEFGKQSVDAMADSFKKFLPIVASVGGALAAFGGKKLLGGLPLVGGFFKSLNPFLTGVMLLAAVSPKLRDSLMRIGESLKPMIPAVIALSKAFADTLSTVIDLATGMLDAFGPVIASVLGGLANALKVVAGSLMYLKPVLLMVGLLMLKNMAFGALMANQRVVALIGSFKAMGIAVKMAIAEQKLYSLTVSQGGQAITTFQAALYALKAGLAGVRAAVVGLMSSMLPLVAVFAGIQIFMAWRKEQQATEERTKELTQSVKDQVYAMKGNVKTINEFVQGQRDLAGVLTSGSDAANELGSALNVIGADAETTLKAFSGGEDTIRAFNEQMVKMSGIQFDSNQLDAFLTIVENQGGWANIDSIMKKTGGLSAQQVVLADNLKKVNDLMKSTDPAAYVMENIKYIAGIDKLGKKAYEYATAEAFKNEAVKGSIDTYEEAVIVQDLFAKKYAELSAKARASKAETDEVKKAVDFQNASTISLVHALNGLRDATDDNIVKAQMFAEKFYGQKTKQNEMLAKFQQIREQTTELASSLESTAGNTDLFAKAGMSLFNQLTENSAAIFTLGGNTADVANYQKSATEQFYKAAESAGWQRQKVDELLTSLGILQGLEKITVQVDLDIEAFKKKILLAGEALALLNQGIGGDKEDARKTQTFIGRLQQVVSQLEASKKAGIGAADSFSRWNDSTDKASKAADRLEKEKEKLRKKIMEVAQKALASATERMEEYADAMKRMSDAAKTAIYGMYSLNDAFSDAAEPINGVNQQMTEYNNQVADGIRQTLSFSNALSGYEQTQSDLVQANRSVEEAQAKLNEEIMLYEQLLGAAEGTEGRRARRLAYEEAAKQLERVIGAQTELADATQRANDVQGQQQSVMERLRAQYQQAVQFSGQLQELVSRGLSQEGVSQLLAMGAETGGRFATELLNGGEDAIGEVNEMFTGLTRLSEQAAEATRGRFFNIGNNLGSSFLDALNSRAEDAAKFAERIRQLVQMGLSAENIRMVIEAGTEAGTQIADAIIAGGSSTIGRMNELEASLRRSAEDLGKYLNDSFYQSGYDLASQIVKGMKDQIEQLEEEIADATVAELKAILERVRGEFGEEPLPLAPGGIGGVGGGSFGGDFAGLQPAIDEWVDSTAGAEWRNAFEQTLEGIQLRELIDFGTIRTYELPPMVAPPVPPVFFTDVLAPLSEIAAAVEPFSMISAVEEPGKFDRVYGVQSPTNINVTVNAGAGADGKAVGDAIVDELRKWNRRNGSLPLEVM